MLPFAPKKITIVYFTMTLKRSKSNSNRFPLWFTKKPRALNLITFGLVCILVTGFTIPILLIFLFFFLLICYFQHSKLPDSSIFFDRITKNHPSPLHCTQTNRKIKYSVGMVKPFSLSAFSLNNSWFISIVPHSKFNSPERKLLVAVTTLTWFKVHFSYRKSHFCSGAAFFYLDIFITCIRIFFSLSQSHNWR